MRLIDADGLMEEIRKQKLLAKEPATKKCIEIIKSATTYTEPPEIGIWIPVEERLPKTDEGYAHVVVSMDDCFVCTTDYTDNDGFELWADSGEVIAWMQLPKPFTL